MIIDIIAGAVTAAIAGMGVGGGGLLVIYLTLIKDMPQLAAQGINLLFFIPSGLISFLIQLKSHKPDKKLLLILCLAGTTGTIAGALFSAVLPARAVRSVFGIFMTLSGVYELFFKSSADKKRQSKGDGSGKKSGENVRRTEKEKSEK